ncbi:MAG TPA: hypothetical protein VFS02_13820 [Telluria sp.]|nr:hypothetical protein [Telluria sp.]
MASFRNLGPQGLAPLSALNADSLRTTAPFDPPSSDDPAIEALQLAPIARAAAYALKRAHPAVTFTSGRRNKQDQARAMASNVARNRRWIAQTYLASPLCSKCQDWVDAYPERTTWQEISAGLLSVLERASDADLARFSFHLAGLAFDVQPVSVEAERIKATIRQLPGLDKFLDNEGGLVRWHAQFRGA